LLNEKPLTAKDTKVHEGSGASGQNVTGSVLAFLRDPWCPLWLVLTYFWTELFKEQVCG